MWAIAGNDGESALKQRLRLPGGVCNSFSCKLPQCPILGAGCCALAHRSYRAYPAGQEVV
jgi:hypothetical protein